MIPADGLQLLDWGATLLKDSQEQPYEGSE